MTSICKIHLKIPLDPFRRRLVCNQRRILPTVIE